MALNLDSKIPSGPIETKWDRHRFDLKLVNPANKRRYEVIVVGSGLAGASAAASLAELARPLRVARELDECGRQCSRVTGRHEEPRLTRHDDLG
mgnify:CR=1 FL=1